MQLLIDGRPLVGHRTGIGVHTAEIASRLALEPPPLIASHAEIENREGLEACAFRVDPAPLGVFWQQWMLPKIPGDVVWGPHGTLPMSERRPAVVTLHDLTSITMPERHRVRTVLSFNVFIARSLERASRVACVSRGVADEAMRGFGLQASRIEIVPNGVDDFFSPGGTEGDYVFYAGTLEPRKGVADLVDAWQSLPAPRPRLVLAGSAGWGSAIPPREGIEITGYVSREKLRDLYRGAKAFVYPSRHEGFGIPPLEAMACGAPVIATRTGAIPDFGTGVVRIVEPGDRGELRAELARVLADPALRREMRERGPARAALWRWDASAARMRALFEEAARCA